MARKRILLVDTSSILHIVKHSGVKYLKEKDKTSYITLGFLLKLQMFMQKTKPNLCVFATDSSPKDSLRKKLYPSYKEKRNSKEKTEEEKALDAIAYPQFATVEEEILPMMGYSNIFMTKGLEADDIIGKICKTYTKCEIVIITTDQDMYQLLSPTVCILKPQTNSFYTHKMFEKEYGIEPKMWKRVKAMGGCHSDEVEGIKGVAEKTAIKYIKGELPKHHQTFKRIESREGKDIINRNKALVILPFRGTPHYFIEPDRISKIKVKGMAEKFNFIPILSDLENWTLTLKGWGSV